MDFAYPVPLAYLFGEQVQQSSEQFVCGGLGVLALLGIGESCAVNVAVLVAWQPFFQLLTGLCYKRWSHSQHSHKSFTSVGNRRWLS